MVVSEDNDLAMVISRAYINIMGLKAVVTSI